MTTKVELIGLDLELISLDPGNPWWLPPQQVTLQRDCTTRWF